MFSFESPHRGDSNEYIEYTIFNMKKEKHPKLSQICSYRIFSEGLKNSFEAAVVNELSVFEPLKFYCINKNSARIMSLAQGQCHCQHLNFVHRLRKNLFISGP